MLFCRDMFFSIYKGIACAAERATELSNRDTKRANVCAQVAKKKWGGSHMSTRRDFLKGAGALAGLVFCGCGLPTAAHAQKPAARLPVMVKGKRIKTIDSHAHCFFQEAIDLMGEDAARVPPPVKGVKEHFIVVEQRLKEMDAMAIDMEILSINPFWYRKDRETAQKSARSTTRSLPSCVRRNRTVSAHLPRCRCRRPTSLRKCSKPRSRSRA